MRSQRRPITVPIAIALAAAVMSLTACATPREGGIDDPGATPTAVSKSELVSLCEEFASETSDAARVQLEAADVHPEKARMAQRPDGLYFVLFPIDAEGTVAPVEYGCLITSDKKLDSAWGRIPPKVDDFEKWATGQLPNEDA